MSRTTPLYAEHLAANGRMVDFSGWNMPLHYGSQIEEHHQVRHDAGIFDVSHMGIVDIEGAGVRSALRGLLANDVAKIKFPGQALYSVMLNSQGGIIDDLIIYGLGEGRFRMVLNAATHEKDMAWLRSHLPADSLHERRDLAILAIQGPNARTRMAGQFNNEGAEILMKVKPFAGIEIGNWFIARTGYTGEDGFEIMLPADEAPILWQNLLTAGVKPAGLGARDTLRLEAGLSLYGADIDENVTPLEANLGWTVAWLGERDFIGRSVLQDQQQQGVAHKQVGVVLLGRGVLRGGQEIFCDGGGNGRITSGSFSPTLESAIGLARMPIESGEQAEVEMRGQRMPVRLIRPPFVWHGQSCL